jgi:hypothetical protein
MIDKLLQLPLPEQLKALIEKLEGQEIDARSLRKIGEFLGELKLTRYERFVVGRVYKRVRRLSDMNRIMNEIIIGESESGYHIGMDLNTKLRAAIDGAAVWNGQVPTSQNPYQNAYPQNLTSPEQARRVVARPKART